MVDTHNNLGVQGDLTQFGHYVRCVSGELPLPVLTTGEISGITTTSAVSGGNITIDGGTAVTARGVCWSTNQKPTNADNKTINGFGTGTFTSNLTGLTAGTTYYVRAFATKSTGTAYGSQIIFDTPSVTFAVGQSYQGGIIAYIGKR